MTLELMERRCARCGETKPLGDFPRSKNEIGGRGYWCKPCSREAANAYNARMRAVLGEDEVRRRQRERTTRHRSTPEGREASRLQSRITREALSRLRDAHRDEYEALLHLVRYEFTSEREAAS